MAMLLSSRTLLYALILSIVSRVIALPRLDEGKLLIPRTRLPEYYQTISQTFNGPIQNIVALWTQIETQDDLQDRYDLLATHTLLYHAIDQEPADRIVPGPEQGQRGRIRLTIVPYFAFGPTTNGDPTRLTYGHLQFIFRHWLRDTAPLPHTATYTVQIDRRYTDMNGRGMRVPLGYVTVAIAPPNPSNPSSPSQSPQTSSSPMSATVTGGVLEPKPTGGGGGGSGGSFGSPLNEPTDPGDGIFDDRGIGTIGDAPAYKVRKLDPKDPTIPRDGTTTAAVTVAGLVLLASLSG